MAKKTVCLIDVAVFRPPLPCTSGVPHPHKAVGKVFASREEFEQERQLLERVRRFDPRGEFAIPFYHDCEARLHPMATDTTADYKNCRSLARRRNAPQLVLQDGGVSLETLLARPRGLSPVLFVRLMALLRPVVVGRHATRKRERER